ncbi:MAG: hypothetical protein Q7J79_09545, partial [Gemmatimonadales bacterium]|nr:hypothetical protein [Gemmatimonadales bacterium]
MKKAGIMAAAVGGVLVTLAVIAGCGRDIGGSARDVTGPAGALAEGARVSGTLSGSVQLIDTGGTPVERQALVAPFEARMSGGVARTDSVGTVATTRVLGDARRAVNFTDREGHRNEVVLSAEGAESPLSRVQHYRDGHLLVDVSYGWDRRPGGWVLRDRDFQLLRDGRLVLRRHQSAVEL